MEFYGLLSHVRFCLLTFCVPGLLMAIPACAGTQDPTVFQEGQLIHVKTGKLLTFEALAPDLLEADVIYVGEEHYTSSHIKAALKVMEILLAADRKPALAMEMFSWDGQQALDRYGRDEIVSQDQFLQESGWNDNWGGDFEDYAPLLTFAKAQHIPVYALNPPRTLVRLVASKGLDEAGRDPLMKEWGVEKGISLDDPEYRQVIFEQIESCHPGLPDKAYQRFFEASTFRDEGMAKVIRDYLQKKSAETGPLVSYTGGGHIQYKIPVPKRVRKSSENTIHDVSIYLIALDPAREQEVEEAIDEGIADYVWLTALGPRGPQKRCG